MACRWGIGHIRPATEIATDHRAIPVANTAMFGALMQAGNLGLPFEA